MKTILLLSLLPLFTIPVLRAQTSTLATVEENGTRGTRLNLVFLSEGYTSGQMGTFASDVDDAVTFLFTREPWSRYRSYCNIYRIEIASNQSGTDNGQSGGQKDTYFQTGFNTPGITQLNTLAGSGSSRAYALLNKHVPEYDIPIILINDPKYGGSGGPLALTTTDPSSVGILEHELGHSFAKLTDEYDEEYAGYPNTEYPNATAKTVLSQIRWNVWIESGTPLFTPENDFNYADKVGHFEGANYHKDDWYRPHDNALMRNLYRPPGNVTREAIVLTYYSKIPLIDSITPTTLTQTFAAPAPLTLTVTTKVPSTLPALTVEWRDNEVTIPGETGTSLIRNTKTFGNGTHRIKAVVRDPTDWVRRDPTALVVEEVTWTLLLSNQTDPPIINTPLPATRVLPLGFTLMLDATATGPGPITYQWLKNNVPLNPAVTTPTLNVGTVSLTHAGTYTVKITNPAHTRLHSTVLAVLDPNVPRVVVGKGKTATLSFIASANLPPVMWSRFGTISNDTHYAGATTKALQIKNVDVSDSGNYFFYSGDYGPSPAIQLLVVTTKTDYTGTTPTLPAGIIGAYYNQDFPLPTDPLKTPNSFTGTLPAGLKMDIKTGRITGFPTVASKDEILGDEITFTVGNEFGKVPVKIRLLIKPLPPGSAGFFSGLVLQNSSLGGSTGGRIDFNVMTTGSYSGSAIIGTETLPFTGKLWVYTPNDTSANGSIVLKPKHAAAAIYLPFTISNDGDADPLTATIAVSQQFFAWRNKWLAPEAADPMKGYYTFAFTVPAGADVPKGNGFGSLTIDATGKTVVTGRVADGETFNTTSHLSPEGKVIIYQTLYTTAAKGSLIALLDIDPGVAAPPVFANTSGALWQRPSDDRSTARTYKSGFGPVDMGVIGGFYTPPVTGAIIMGLPAATGSPLKNAQLSFATTLGADLLPVNADVSLEIKPGGTTKVNTPNPKLVTFSVTPADGRFKGSYTTKDNDPRPPLSATPRPQISRKVDYQGIILTDDGTPSGYGFFLRDALPKADGSTAPTTSPKDSGEMRLNAF
jgi:hypothetical protein